MEDELRSQILTLDFKIIKLRKIAIIYKLSPTLQDRCRQNDAGRVDATIQDFRIILFWANHHYEAGDLDILPYKSEEGNVEPCSWDRDFFQGFDLRIIYDVIAAASFLRMTPLLAITQKIVQERVMDMTPEEHSAASHPHLPLNDSDNKTV